MSVAQRGQPPSVRRAHARTPPHLSAAGVTLLTVALTACGGGGDGSTVVASTAVAPTSTVAPVPASAAEVALEISATEPNTYHWDVLGVGKSVHVDSSEEFTAIPGRCDCVPY